MENINKIFETFPLLAVLIGLFCIFFVFPRYAKRETKFDDILLNLSKKQKGILCEKIKIYLKEYGLGKGVAGLIIALEQKKYIVVKNLSAVIKIISKRFNVEIDYNSVNQYYRGHNCKSVRGDELIRISEKIDINK